MAMRSIVPFGWGGSTLPGRMANDDPFIRLWNDVDQLFRNVIGDVGPGEWLRTGSFGPPVEVSETSTELKVVAELPGVDEKDVSVELQGDTLVIRGEKKAEEERKEGGYHLAERRYGSFSRALRLPCEIDADKVRATFKNGVLTITMPKPAELQRQPKRIEVKAAA
ncbi:Hsp20/alpha crystallin family protein [Benzoatithermus flavus]|uniref:Hsp20/alpha crystallin family protein n=1 Tax=Benzoatithermus flavus TaxID=3108223 RepID=A0ABU8XS07_9PROT